jgi:hypothetical protein
VPVMVELAWACPARLVRSRTSDNRNNLYLAGVARFTVMHHSPLKLVIRYCIWRRVRGQVIALTMRRGVDPAFSTLEATVT